MAAVEGPLAGVEPANVWGFFNELTKIPRPSKNEQKYAHFPVPASCLALLTS